MVLPGSGRAKLTVRHIGSVGILERDLIQGLLVVIRGCENAYLVRIPEPTGLNQAASEKPRRCLQMNRVIGAEHLHAGRGRVVQSPARTQRNLIGLEPGKFRNQSACTQIERVGDTQRRGAPKGPGRDATARTHGRKAAVLTGGYGSIHGLKGILCTPACVQLKTKGAAAGGVLLTHHAALLLWPTPDPEEAKNSSAKTLPFMALPRLFSIAIPRRYYSPGLLSSSACERPPRRVDSATTSRQ